MQPNLCLTSEMLMVIRVIIQTSTRSRRGNTCFAPLGGGTEQELLWAWLNRVEDVATIDA